MRLRTIMDIIEITIVKEIETIEIEIIIIIKTIEIIKKGSVTTIKEKEGIVYPGPVQGV
jgi:hypothetical protein